MFFSIQAALWYQPRHPLAGPLRNKYLGVLLQMKLASLPGDVARDRLPSGFQTGMITIDGELDIAQTAPG
jgi:hypothetical protein